MDIKADVKSIKNLKDYFFVVPDYQREYVWESDNQVYRFLQDINDEFNAANNPKSNYFIGNTIIVEGKDGAFDVVDGQQRLTTIIITLCAIRCVLKNTNINDSELIEKKKQLVKVVEELLYEYDFNKNKYTPRLTLQYPESKDYLLNLITEKDFTETTTRSIKKMGEAYLTVLDFLNTELKSNDDSVIVNFVSYFLVNVQMVVIKPDNLGSALKIFETINERGVGLNAMDLLKNLLFIHAKSYEFEEIKQIWEGMLKNINESGEGDKPLRFLRYFLTARYRNGRIMREDEIYIWMTKEGKTNINYEKKPVNFAKELRSSALKYSLFVKATKAKDADRIYPSITGIGYLNKKTSRAHLVLLMALKDNIDNSIINLLAKNIESLIFYYAANRTLTKYYEDNFAKWAIELRMLNTIDDLRIFLQGDFKKEFDEQQLKFNSQFATKSEVDLSPTTRIKYILGKIEEYIRAKVNFPSANYIFYQSQQLEHILPQTGENIPNNSYPQPYDYPNTVYMFGNLTLLEAPINQSLNFSNDISTNQWFDVKRNAYLNSNILLTRTFSEIKIGEQTIFNDFANTELKAFGDWNMETVRERQEILRKLILEIWKLEMEVDISQESKNRIKPFSKIHESTAGTRAPNGEKSLWAELPKETKDAVREYALSLNSMDTQLVLDSVLIKFPNLKSAIESAENKKLIWVMLNRKLNGESKERSAWASLSEDEKFIIAENIRETKQTNPLIKDSELQTQFNIPSASTVGHILTYNQLKPSIRDIAYIFKGIPNDFFPADAPLPFEENYKGDCNFSNDKDGNYIKGSVGTGKYGKFANRPAIVQAALKQAKLTNTICDFKSLNKTLNEE